MTVGAAGTVPITLDPFVVPTYAGEPVTVTPLVHARGGSGDIRLASVPPSPMSPSYPDFDGGTFRSRRPNPVPYYVDFAVTDGVQTTSGLVRIDVSPSANGPTTPITVPHTAFVRTQSTSPST